MSLRVSLASTEQTQPMTPQQPQPRRDEDDLDAAIARAESLKDAPDPTVPPEIPEVLRTPVKRPASMQRKPSPLASFGDVGKALAIGLDFLFTAAAGAVVGYLIDRWQGSMPTGTVVGAGLGFLAGTVRLITRLNRDDRPKRPPGATPPAGPTKPRN